MARRVEVLLKTLSHEEIPLYKDPEVQSLLGDELIHTPEPCGSIIRLFYYENLSMEEIAEIDDWANPSQSLVPEIYHLSEEESCLVCVPAGYANCLKAHTPDSIMLVLSDKTLEEAKDDSWRYDKTMWVDWTKLEK